MTIRLIILLVLLTVTPVMCLFAEQIQVKLIMVDQVDQQPIQNAHIYLDGELYGASDGNGLITLLLDKDATYTLRITHIAFRHFQIDFTIDGRETVVIQLTRNSERLNDIVVFASPTGSGVQYQSGSEIGIQSLIQKAGTSLGSMLDGETGVSMRSMGPAATRPIIRGLDGDRILILENGLRMGDISGTAADHTIALDPAALKSVEIVRGPSSLLYGSSAIGGVINLRTADIPSGNSDIMDGFIQSGYSTVNEMVSLSARFGGKSGYHSYTTRISSKNAGDIHTPGFRIPDTDVNSLEYAIGYGFSLDRLEFGTAFSGISGSYGIPTAPDSDESIRINYSRNMVQGQVDFTSNNWIKKHEIRYNISTYDQQESVSVSEDSGFSSDYIALAYDLNASNIDYRLHHHDNSISDRGIIGLSALMRTYDVSGEDAFTPGDRIRSFALYTFQEREMFEYLSAQMGFRLDSRWLSTLENSANPGIDENRSDQNLAFSIGLNFRLNLFDGAFQFSRSHRQVGVEELFSYGPHLGAGVFEIGDPELKNESASGFDAMIRYQNEGTKAELSLFSNKIRNFVMFSPLGFSDSDSGLPVYAYTASNAILQGVELELAHAITYNWSSFISADYVHGRLDDAQSTPLPLMPPLRMNLQLNYESSSYWAGIQVRRIAEQSRVSDNENKTPGYILMNMNAGYRFGKKQLYAFHLRVDNILNAKYRDHLTRMEHRNYFMPGRNINLILTMNF